jgi:hypothetical protein
MIQGEIIVGRNNRRTPFVLGPGYIFVCTGVVVRPRSSILSLASPGLVSRNETCLWDLVFGHKLAFSLFFV